MSLQLTRRPSTPNVQPSSTGLVRTLRKSISSWSGCRNLSGAAFDLTLCCILGFRAWHTVAFQSQVVLPGVGPTTREQCLRIVLRAWSHHRATQTTLRKTILKSARVASRFMKLRAAWKQWYSITAAHKGFQVCARQGQVSALCCTSTAARLFFRWFVQH